MSEDGGFVVTSKTLGRGPLLSPDDAVIWVPDAFSDEVAKLSSDRRFGWVGLIRAKVNFPAPLSNSSKHHSVRLRPRTRRNIPMLKWLLWLFPRH